jgi:hypothetical protein
VSDPDKSYIDAAKTRLFRPSLATRGTKYQFADNPAEDMASWVPAGSVDMVSFGESIHRTDHASAINATTATATLKPNGTLAIWLYYRNPYFAELPAANRVLSQIYEATESHFQKVPTRERAIMVTNSELEVIDLSSQRLKDVKHLKWHHPKPKLPIELESAVGETDIIEIMDGKCYDISLFKGLVSR